MKIKSILSLIVSGLMISCTSQQLIPIKTFTPCEWIHNPVKNGKIETGAVNCFTISANEREYFIVTPRYPRKALDKKIEGYVKLKIWFNKEGEAFRAEILESEPEGVFDAVMLRLADKWRVRRIDGKPLAGTHSVTQRINMKLPKNSS